MYSCLTKYRKYFVVCDIKYSNVFHPMSVMQRWNYISHIWIFEPNSLDKEAERQRERRREIEGEIGRDRDIERDRGR